MMHWLLTILILPYIFILLSIYRSLVKIEPFILTTDPGIFVSVVVACHNEQEKMHALLSCFNSQDYPVELFEIIIVDDNSTDRTLEIASGYTGSCNITALYNNGKGKKQALRTGIHASSGDLVITTDADCQMGKKWIRTISAFFEKHRPDLIICPVQIKAGKGFFRRFQELEFLGLQGITAGSAVSGKATMCNGANLAFTRKAYLDNSGNLHDEIASGDDIFLLHSLRNKTGSVILWLGSDKAMVTTDPSPTIRSFLKQRIRWISKGKAYYDSYTILLAIVTFITIIAQISAMVAAFINPLQWWIFLTIFTLKSVPDFLILRKTALRYERPELMNWFLPAQILYPFYVISVVVFTFMLRKTQEN